MVRTIINTSFNTKRLLKPAINIMMFLISIIGPITINPIIEPKENRPTKLLAIKASDVEQAENKNAADIIIRSGSVYSELRLL